MIIAMYRPFARCSGYIKFMLKCWASSLHLVSVLCTFYSSNSNLPTKLARMKAILITRIGVIDRSRLLFLSSLLNPSSTGSDPTKGWLIFVWFGVQSTILSVSAYKVKRNRLSLFIPWNDTLGMNLVPRPDIRVCGVFHYHALPVPSRGT